MRKPSPRITGVMLLIAGLALALFLALAQSAPGTMLPKAAIAVLVLISALCVAFGGFMIARNRNPRTDSGVR